MSRSWISSAVVRSDSFTMVLLLQLVQSFRRCPTGPHEAFRIVLRFRCDSGDDKPVADGTVQASSTGYAPPVDEAPAIGKHPGRHWCVDSRALVRSPEASPLRCRGRDVPLAGAHRVLVVRRVGRRLSTPEEYTTIGIIAGPLAGPSGGRRIGPILYDRLRPLPIARVSPGPAHHRRCAMTALLVGSARVSTDQQDLTSQRDGLAALGVAESRIYVDHGLTGTNRERPGLREALASCREG